MNFRMTSSTCALQDVANRHGQARCHKTCLVTRCQAGSVEDGAAGSCLDAVDIDLFCIFMNVLFGTAYCGTKTRV